MKIKLLLDEVVVYEKEVTAEIPVTPPDTSPKPPPDVPPVIPPSTGPGDGTALNPYKLNNLQGGAYIREGATSPSFGLGGGKDAYFEVIPQGFNSFSMSVKGFGNSEYLLFYYAVWDFGMTQVLKEYTRLKQNRSLSHDQAKSFIPSGWDMDNIRYVYRVLNAGTKPATMEVAWTGNV